MNNKTKQQLVREEIEKVIVGHDVLGFAKQGDIRLEIKNTTVDKIMAIFAREQEERDKGVIRRIQDFENSNYDFFVKLIRNDIEDYLGLTTQLPEEKEV